MIKAKTKAKAKTKSKKTWKSKLNDIRANKKAGINNLYDRIAWLIELKEDRGFIEDCDSRNVNWEDELDREVDDTSQPFGVWEAVMKAFPKKESWKKSLRSMLDETIETLRAPRREERNRPSYKQIAADQAKKIAKLEKKIVGITANPGDPSSESDSTSVDYRSLWEAQSDMISKLQETIHSQNETITMLRHKLAAR